MKKNLKENILVITSFPPKGKTHGDKVVGIASYAKNTLRSILNTKSVKRVSFDILAEKLDGEEAEYKEGKMNVKRIWQRNSFLAFPLLLTEIIRNHRSAKTILFEFELSMFGSILFLLPFPLLLLILRALGKKIIFVCHQVIPDMDEIAPHMNLGQESIRVDLMSLLLKAFYAFVLIVSSKVIVFEEELKEKLGELGNSRKIVVIPHGSEEFRNVPTKLEARKKLGIPKNTFVVMSFGFLAWYKGTDWLIHAMDELKRTGKSRSRDVQLVLAGGANPNNADKDYYQRYIKNISRACEKNGFILTGFIPENKISQYYKAADLVVLPYRTFMSASGPLSITFSLKKPFLLSPKLRGVLESDDMKKLLSETKLKEKDIVFKDFYGDLAKKVIKLKDNNRLISRLAKFSNEAGKMRRWEIIGRKYYEEIVG